jgi:predicted aspartyl protease
VKLGKVIEKLRVTNLFEPEKSIQIEAVIDTGATMMVLPRNIVEELNLGRCEK